LAVPDEDGDHVAQLAHLEEVARDLSLLLPAAAVGVEDAIAQKGIQRFPKVVALP
jgi:hypothetical protein